MGVSGKMILFDTSHSPKMYFQSGISPHMRNMQPNEGMEARQLKGSEL